MAGNVQFHPLTHALPSLMGHASASLQELAESVPELHTIDRAALLANVQDDMAALLASVMRRQASRRTDTISERQNSKHDEVSDGERDDNVEKVRSLLQSAGAGWKAAYDLARGLFPDPAELALLLASLRDDVELEEAIREEIERALDELIAQHGFEKLAPSLNIRQVVDSFATRTGLTPESLRKAYGSLLGGGSGESVTYRYLIDAFGFEQRGMALDFLEQALAVDMAAETPSRTTGTFRPLLDLLFQFRLLRSADALLITAARQQQGPGRSSRPEEKANLLDRAVVELLLSALTDLHAACQKFTEFLQNWRAVAADKQIAQWARGILGAFSDIPVELFPDLAYREALLISMSETLSSLFYGGDSTRTQLGLPHV